MRAKRKEHCSMLDIVNDILAKHKAGNTPLDVFKLCRENVTNVKQTLLLFFSCSRKKGGK